MEAAATKKKAHLVVLVDSNEQAHYAKKGTDRARFLAENIQLAEEVLVRPLTGGDYAFVWVNDAGDEYVLALIERKTMQDLLASIVDTRYVSQAERLVATLVPHIYWAVVEGTLYHPEDVTRVHTAMSHLNTRPRTVVLRLRDGEHEFVRELAALARYLVAMHTTDGELDACSSAPLYSLAKERGEKIRLDAQPIVFEAQLALIRGMSRKKARSVMAVADSQLALHVLWAQRRRDFIAREAGAAAVSSSSSASKRGSKKKRTLEEYLDEPLAAVVGPALSAKIRTTTCPDVAALAALTQ